MGIRRFFGRLLADYLTAPSSAPYRSVPTDPAKLTATIRAGDVLLAEGRQRISTAIKYLTQSTWSHAALCVEKQLLPDGTWTALFVEADVSDGVKLVSGDAFEGLHTRICRPVGLSAAEIASLVENALSRVGHTYDLRNVIDLARYLFPLPPVPTAWRRRMIALGSGEPTKAICSSLVAQAFQSIHYPILPDFTFEIAGAVDRADCAREIAHIRHHSLFAPRDFDVSPYFEIVKPSLHQGFDHHALRWTGG